MRAEDAAALHGLRVAWSVDFGYAPVDPEVRRVTAAAAERAHVLVHGAPDEDVRGHAGREGESDKAAWRKADPLAQADDRVEHRPELGDGAQPTPADVRRAVRLSLAVCASATVLASLLAERLRG